jgi:hypothetical protein
MLRHALGVNIRHIEAVPAKGLNLGRRRANTQL